MTFVAHDTPRGPIREPPSWLGVTTQWYGYGESRPSWPRLDLYEVRCTQQPERKQARQFLFTRVKNQWKQSSFEWVHQGYISKPVQQQRSAQLARIFNTSLLHQSLFTPFVVFLAIISYNIIILGSPLFRFALIEHSTRILGRGNIGIQQMLF